MEAKVENFDLQFPACEVYMRSLPISQIFLTTFAACLLAACGGGDGAAMSDADGYTVESGLAQKGPLSQGSAIWINELAVSTYNQNGKGYTFRTTNNIGAFDPSGYKFGTPYLNTVAQGYYFNEITGTQADDMVLLSGLSQIGKVGTVAADTAINVNVLSSMAVNRTLKLAQAKPVVTFAVARAQAQKEVLAAFNIYNGAALFTGATAGGVTQPANLTALDLSKSRAGDQLLAAISAVVMQAGSNGAGVNALLSQAASDLADDGLLNNSTRYTTSVQSQLCVAAATTDFARVATNLNTLYGTNYSATDLSQWVDTSGCVDQVINKYKFSASNVAVGTVSKSPAYTIGADDVGQCFSVGGVTTGATAGLYYNGAATAVVGTQLVKAGDSVTIGINASTAGTYSGFIQRSAPATNGACPTVVPGGGLTRVLKYTTVNGYTVGGTVSGLNGGQSVTLLNNGGNAVTVSANGAFAFSDAVPANSNYTVTVGTQPSNETCAVTNGAGTITSNSVSNVSVVCSSAVLFSFPQDFGALTVSGPGPAPLMSPSTRYPNQNITSVYFNGQSQIDINNPQLKIGSANFRVHLEFKTNNTTYYSNIIGSELQNSLSMSDDIAIGSFFNWGLPSTVLKTSFAVNDNNWHFVDAVRQGGLLTLYVDGNKIGDDSVDGNLLFDFSIMRIGHLTGYWSGNWDNSFIGFIDNFYIKVSSGVVYP